MSAVFLDLGSVDAGDLELSRLRAAYPRWTLHASTFASETAARIAGARIVVTNKVVLDRAAIKAAPLLRLIAVTATGTNNIDLAAAAERGIAVVNLRAYATPAVVQHVLAVMLAFATRWQDYDRDVRAGAWSAATHFCMLDHPIGELAGRTLGIVGFGELGRGVARIAEAFGMQVLVAARPGSADLPPGRVSLDELLRESHYVSLHCPLTAQTQGLIGAAAFARMRRDAVLINTARGAIVDAAALAVALRAGTIAGAAIDVLEREPPPADHPLLAPDIPNLILTPHTAWASREARQRAIDGTAANLRAFLAGTPENLVRA
ncbi:MAG: D-2-hydroxyacid dehydrogenase [Chromatiales bacterium]|nr:D-2-hydroxyacid dehydrogenase [Chromatiales bacterium]